ncbi:metal ABC transporter substrate-binding protein [Georgenia faecalis]|uniref:Metal ABC transporter substrate-binding protein n=1 Tax=Georgenia faecalis TaxID=2483799 RepID=A0ABV9DA07_9MICO|nr:metal ABC transporter substrate-binding protein [Georgenia faecalis]
MRTMFIRRATATAAATAAVVALAGCGANESGGSAGASGGDTTLEVVTSVYPLQFVAERVGGEYVDVASLLPAQGDAHNVELSPREVADLEAADLVVTVSGLQPAVDDAVAVAGLTAYDAADDADLHPADELGHTDDTDEITEHDHDHGSVDPHFWLDPERLATVTGALAEELAALDPDHADTFRANAAALEEELTALEEEYRTGLAACPSETIVVAHEAYGYLADRYGLHQEGVAGIDPETEPSPARLAEIGDIVEDEGVSTIFVESAVAPAVSEALAEDLGVSTAVLDPLEVQQDPDADYLDVMRANLDALRTALGCAA